MAIDFESIFGGYPKEVRHLDWRTRESVVNECQLRSNQGKGPRQSLASKARLFLPFLAASVVLFLGELVGESIGFIASLACLLVVFVSLMWGLLEFRRHDRFVLRQVLLERGIRPARCFQCGYDVSHTPADACPECGDVLLSPGAKEDRARE